MNRAMATFILLLAAFFWGAGNVANKTVLEHIGPMTAVCMRSLLAALIIAPLAAREMRGSALHWADARLKSGVVLGGLFAVALALQQVAYQHTTVTNASFLVNTASIMTPMIGWMLFGHRPGLRIVVAAAITVAGAFLMAGQVSLAHLNRGDVACLASAVFYAGWMVALGRHAVRFGGPFSTCLVQFSVTALILCPVALLTEAPSLAGAFAAWRELVVLGVFSTAVAFLLQTWGQGHVPAPVAAVLVSAESLFGAFGAWLLLGERTPLAGLIGAGLIFGGIVIAATGGMRLAPGRRRVNARAVVRRTPDLHTII